MAGVAYGAGPRQRLDVYAPVAPQNSLRPVVVFFYGGAWSSGRREDYAFVGRALAAQGFVVVVPDYRLVPEVRFPTFLEDSAAAVRWARENAAAFGGDGKRITLVGHSAGAYNAAMLALDPRWLGPDRAAVRGFVTLAGPFDFLPLDDPATIAAFGAWPRPEETQPVFHATADDPPALLLHGAADDRVRLRNSEALKARLDAVGGGPELIVCPGSATSESSPRWRAHSVTERLCSRTSPPSSGREARSTRTRNSTPLALARWND